MTILFALYFSVLRSSFFVPYLDPHMVKTTLPGFPALILTAMKDQNKIPGRGISFYESALFHYLHVDVKHETEASNWHVNIHL